VTRDDNRLFKNSEPVPGRVDHHRRQFCQNRDMSVTNPRRPLETGLIASILGWMYGPVMAAIALRWSDTPEYSHGWIVPAFALWFVWSHQGQRPFLWRDFISPGPILFAVGVALIVVVPTWDSAVTWATVGSVMAACGAGLCLPEIRSNPIGFSWSGWGLVIAGVGALVAGAYFFIDWLVAASMIPLLLGLAQLRWGAATPRSVWWAVPFLVFMIPLPFSVETGLREPLRGLATAASTYVLQALGFPCLAEGYVIVIGEAHLGVTEACSGLSMLMVFAALTMAGVMLLKRPWWHRAILAVSWPVIAIVANVFRIVVTGGLYALGQEKLADITYHDLAGLAMMPIGLALLWLEMWYLDQLILVDRGQRLGPLLGASIEPAAGLAVQKG
jgi:exosortase